jgi:hypothetical protein
MKPIGCPKKSVRNYRCFLHKNPEERNFLVKGLLPVQLIPTYEISWWYAGTLHHRHLNFKPTRTKCLQWRASHSEFHYFFVMLMLVA